MSEPLTILEPGVRIKPEISIQECTQLVEQLYGFKVAFIKELNSYDDRNYKLLIDTKSLSNKYLTEICENGYVFKIMNKLDSLEVSFVEAQNEMMLFLAKNNVSCPIPVKNIKGEFYSIENISGNRNVVRLLEFQPGKILYEVPSDEHLFFQVGEYVAKLDQILKKFSHSAYETRRSLWMLNEVPKLRNFIYAVKNEKHKEMVEEIISNFETEVLPQIDSLEKGIIHGDFNEHNIVVTENENDKNKCPWKICSILDFGDTQRSCYLFELAITTAYMILKSKKLNTGASVIAGYSKIRPIPDTEFKLLKLCIEARIAQSVVMSSYSILSDPDNSYILTTQITGWQMLEKLHQEKSDLLIKHWKETAATFK